MYCPQKITYIVEKGDSLYQIALFFKTTVRDILSLNPSIDPYNLQIGSRITVCPNQSLGGGYASPQKQIQLINEMRLVWEQHVYWTRMFLISVAERLKDEGEVTKRLLQSPADIGAVFGRFYSADVAKEIVGLLTEHIQIGGDLIKALRDGKTAEADSLNRLWHVNADKMADYFSSISPYFNRGDMREMLYSHLGLTTQEVLMRLAGNYAKDISVFNDVEQEALMMADYFADGIMRQFPRDFY